MSRGGTVATHGLFADKREDNGSIHLQYPRGNRLLLGTISNLRKPFLEALDTRYPLEISLQCHDLVAPQRLLSRLSHRAHRRRLRPFAVFFYRQGGLGSRLAQWEFVGRTETILYDEYFRFVTKLKVCCATQEDTENELRVEVYDRRNKSERTEDQAFIGAAQCRLDDIFCEPLLRKEMYLESKSDRPGRVIMSADAILPSEEGKKLTLNLEMASMTKGQHRVFFVLSRQLQFGDYTPVYRSEVLGREEKSFKTMTRDIATLNTGEDDKLLRLELFQFNLRATHIRLGFMQTSIEKLRSARKHSRLLWWPNSICDGDSVIEVGRIVVLDSIIEDGHMQFRLRVTQ